MNAFVLRGAFKWQEEKSLRLVGLVSNFDENGGRGDKKLMRGERGKMRWIEKGRNGGSKIGFSTQKRKYKFANSEEQGTTYFVIESYPTFNL